MKLPINSLHLGLVPPPQSDDLAVAIITAVGLILSSAAWPLAFLTAVIVLRSEIKTLLGRISKIRHGETELSLDQAVRMALGELEVPSAPDSEEVLGETVADVSARAPIDAIVTSWVAIERALEKLPGKMFASGRPRFPTSRRLEELQALGLLTSTLAGRIRELQYLRNRAVHDPDAEISASTVRVYVQNAADVTAEINQLAGKNT